MTRRPPTLFSRLLVLTLPVESVILVLFGVWLIRGIERRELAAFDGSLKAQSMELLGGIALDPAGKLEVDINPHAVAPGTSACVFDGGGKILWELPQDWFKASGLRATSHEPFESVQSTNIGGAGCRVLDATRRLRAPGDTDPYVTTGPLVEVVLAGSLSGLSRSSFELREKAMGTGLALLALTGALLWVAIHVGLRPVRDLMKRLQDIPGPAGAERLDEGLVPVELRPLAREINQMLDRLWGLVELEKRFTAEAAHEFRTPLTIVKSTLQTALLTGGSREDHEGALREALEDLQRLEKTAESLLTLARADALLSGPVPVFEDISLSALLKSISERFTPSAQERSLELALDLRPCRIRGTRLPSSASSAISSTTPSNIRSLAGTSVSSALRRRDSCWPPWPTAVRPYPRRTLRTSSSSSSGGLEGDRQRARAQAWASPSPRPWPACTTPSSPTSGGTGTATGSSSGFQLPKRIDPESSCSSCKTRFESPRS